MIPRRIIRNRGTRITDVTFGEMINHSTLSPVRGQGSKFHILFTLNWYKKNRKLGSNRRYEQLGSLY